MPSTKAFPSARKTHRVSGNFDLGQGDVFQHLLDRTGSERLVSVGAAERAAVMGTAVGDLQDVAVRLAWRPDDHAVVSHGPIMSEDTATDKGSVAAR